MSLFDPATPPIFPELPLVSYRRDRNLRDYLVHSAERSDSDAGTFACRHPRCLTCRHTTSQTILQSPKHLYTIRESFTCQSENVVYSIICRRCGCLYNRELTNRRLSHDGAAGSPYSPASSSCRNLNLRFAVKTTTFMRDRQIYKTD